MQFWEWKSRVSNIQHKNLTDWEVGSILEHLDHRVSIDIYQCYHLSGSHKLQTTPRKAGELKGIVTGPANQYSWKQCLGSKLWWAHPELLAILLYWSRYYIHKQIYQHKSFYPYGPFRPPTFPGLPYRLLLTHTATVINLHFVWQNHFEFLIDSTFQKFLLSNQ